MNQKQFSNMSNVTSLLQHSFEPELLRKIDESSKLMNFKEGETVIKIGQMIRIIPILIKGTIKVSRLDEDGNELLLYYINSNESCAMTFTCCMEQHPSEIQAIAETEIELLTVPIHLMDEWMSKYPSWKHFVMNTIRNRFNELLQAIDQLAFHKLDERLVYYLKEKSRATGSTLINLSHEQIAHEMSSSRVVISRLLKKLEVDKKLLLYRNQIKLLRDM